MTLRRKTLIIISVTTFSLILILYIASQTFLLGSFTRLEKQFVARDVERATSGLSAEIAVLDMMVYDWAAWDDTYSFIQSLSDEYIQSNLVDETFIDLGINLMLFIDRDGQIVFGQAFDLYDEKPTVLPQSLQMHIAGDAFLLRHADVDSSVVGIILLPEAPMLVASRPILTSGNEGPIRGTLIMGRYLDSVEIERLAEAMHLSLTLHQFDDLQIPPDFQVARSSLSEQSPVFVRTLNVESIAGYSLLENIYGEPCLILRVDTPRDIYNQGRSSALYFMSALVAVSLVFGLMILLLLEIVVLSRLTRLGDSVGRIGKSGDLSARVSVAGGDELSDLARTINEMLVALEQAQDELRESEERYRLLFNSSNDIVFVSGMTDEGMPGKLLEANDVAYQRLGYTREELLQLSPLDIAAPENWNDFPAQAQKFLTEGQILFEAVGIAQDGTRVSVEVNARLFDLSGQPAILSIARDITERKQAEEALRESEQRFRDVARTTGDWIWEVDAAGRYTYVSPVVERVLGYTPEEMLGTLIYSLLRVEGREDLGTVIREFRHKKESFKIVSSSVHKDGHTVILETTGLPLTDAEGNLLGYRGVHRDVTTERQLGERLAAVYILGQELVLARNKQGIAQVAVDAARILLQCSLCELWLVDEEGKALVRQAVWAADRVAESDTLRLDDEQGIPVAVARSGALIYLPDARSDPRYVDHGLEIRSELCVPLQVGEQVIGVFSAGSEKLDAFDQDDRRLFLALADQTALATESARLYEAVTEQRENLRTLATRLTETEEAERKQLARELHDQVGQSLTALGINLNILRAQIPQETADPVRDRLDDSLALVKQTTKRIRNVMADLQPPVLEDYGLVAALRWYATQFATRTGVQVIVQGDELALRPTAAIENVLFRITQEALTNVAKHARATQATVTVEMDDERVCLIVNDDGVGFNPTRVSEPGERVRSAPGGWGLFIMAERAEAMGGHFRIESRPQEGTRIIVEVTR